MLIRSIELIGYKRFSLNKIEYLKMSPTEKLQLILGTNGSGKSSLIRELSPLPAASQNYKKDGSKKVLIEHRGNEYILTSTFSPTQNHSFIKNNEELNKGGTASVQKDLVYKDFGITQAIHELMIGDIKFNKMGPNDRKAWLTRLADADFTYALMVFQKLKDRLRDVSGSIKINQSRAVQEANKLLSSEQEETLRKEINIFKSLLVEVIELKSPSVLTVYDTNQQIERNKKQLTVISNAILNCRKQFPNEDNFSSMDDLELKMNETQSNIGFQRLVISKLIKDIEKEQETQQIFSKTKLSNLGDLDKQLAEHFKSIAKIESSLTSALKFENASAAYQAISTIQDNLSDIIADLPVNENRKFSQNSIQKLVDERLHIVRLIQGQQIKLQNAELNKKTQESDREEKPLECPKCEHKWHREYSPAKYQQTLDTIKNCEASLLSLNAELEKCNVLLEEAKAYVFQFRMYNDITKNWPILNPMWEHFLQTDVIFNQPKSIFYQIDKIKSDIWLHIQLDELKEELQALENLKKITAENVTTQLGDIEIKIQGMSNQLFDENQKLKGFESYYERLKFYRDVIKQVQESEKQLEVLMDKEAQLHEELVKSYRNQAFSEIIQQIQIELSEREQRLTQVDIQKFLVANIQSQLSELNEEADMLKLLIRELSPTEGLIAKGLITFINNFIKQMNSFIGKVWLYPMSLVPYTPAEDEGIDLDYTFAVRLNGSKEPIPDIKMVSTAQAEMINLAFVIVALKRLGLHDCTLVLDELGASMDSAHRSSVFNAISGLIAHSDFSQVFVISHFENNYGSLRNTEVTVLCDKNIVLPKNTVYNNHVIIN